ncbi:fibroblast growth factor receptor 1-like [Patiria miniata]|uniref:receptor protein-tyrosine kinase n=1 Tax=Patiria miniata TaxID=46514 RepID=A0A914AFJ2_PATMI|nr:fibroblast growth factor receptor 1-like [Patiria miniata]
MDLTVSNAQVEDEGTYTCLLQSDQGSATLTVEIEGNEPTITLNSDPPVTPIRLIAGEASVLRCTASGFRPAVNLEWYKDDVKITAGVSEDPATNNGDTFTTVGTLTFTPTIEDDGDRLKCRTIGQVVATAKTGGFTLSVQYVPVVTVDYSGGQITCSSDANPLATTHQIIRNGTDIWKTFTNSPGSVEFTTNYCAVISCNATNTIGTGTGRFAQQICPVGVIVGAVVAAFIGGVLVSGIIFYIMKRRHQVQHIGDGLHKTIKHDGDHLNQDGPFKVTPKLEKRKQEMPMATISPAAVYESIRDEGGEASWTSTAEVYSNVGPDLAFPRDLVVIEKELGRGAFGRVLLGTALGIEKTGKRTKVAVKTLKEGGGDHAKAELLEELELMKKVGCHPNVVKLLGHCKEKGPVYVIVEYLAKGDLKKLLMEYRDKDPGSGYSNLPGLSKSLSRTLVKFARDVANGMAFISSQKCVHRDLAARNVLVGDDMVCKVSDFGLARDVMNTRIYQRESQGALPMRWMALESLLDDVYTTESDVWSFGILLWEIVTLGARPYPMMKTKAMVNQLQQGYRMPKPKNCKKQL